MNNTFSTVQRATPPLGPIAARIGGGGYGAAINHDSITAHALLMGRTPKCRRCMDAQARPEAAAS